MSRRKETKDPIAYINPKMYDASVVHFVREMQEIQHKTLEQVVTELILMSKEEYRVNVYEKYIRRNHNDKII